MKTKTKKTRKINKKNKLKGGVRNENNVSLKHFMKLNYYYPYIVPYSDLTEKQKIQKRKTKKDIFTFKEKDFYYVERYAHIQKPCEELKLYGSQTPDQKSFSNVPDPFTPPSDEDAEVEILINNKLIHMLVYAIYVLDIDIIVDVNACRSLSGVNGCNRPILDIELQVLAMLKSKTPEIPLEYYECGIKDFYAGGRDVWERIALLPDTKEQSLLIHCLGGFGRTGSVLFFLTIRDALPTSFPNLNFRDHLHEPFFGYYTYTPAPSTLMSSVSSIFAGTGRYDFHTDALFADMLHFFPSKYLDGTIVQPILNDGKLLETCEMFQVFTSNNLLSANSMSLFVKRLNFIIYSLWYHRTQVVKDEYSQITDIYFYSVKPGCVDRIGICPHHRTTVPYPPPVFGYNDYDGCWCKVLINPFDFIQPHKEKIAVPSGFWGRGPVTYDICTNIRKQYDIDDVTPDDHFIDAAAKNNVKHIVF